MLTARSWLRFCLAVAAFFMLRTLCTAEVITCTSDDMNRHYCRTETRGGVRLVEQHSDAACRKGYSWDYDRGGIWVDHGCRADFATGEGHGRGYRLITCSSDDMRRHYCEAGTRGDVHMVEEHSEAPCRKGYSWDHDSRGVWVDHGCRADFVIEKDWDDHHRPGRTVTCVSNDGGRQFCPAQIRGGVWLQEQHSDSPCRQGYSWGFNFRGIWVDHGCRADFRVDSGWDSRPDHDRDPNVITCASDEMKREYCPVDTRGGVRLVKQRSDADCRKNYSWGYDRGGIWVDHGCRADFAIEQRRDDIWTGRDTNRPPDRSPGMISCSSDDMKRHYCPVDTRAGVRLVKKHSDAACKKGYGWDYDRGGIWVDHGCRADFQVGK